MLNIASSISCHKLAGVALARCLSRQVKNDPPTADRTAQLAGWAMGVLGRPIPRAPGAGGRYIGLEWAVASRSKIPMCASHTSRPGACGPVCVLRVTQKRGSRQSAPQISSPHHTHTSHTHNVGFSFLRFAGQPGGRSLMAQKLRERSAAVLRGPIAVAQSRASAERSAGRPRARSTARDLDQRWLAALVVQRIG